MRFRRKNKKKDMQISTTIHEKYILAFAYRSEYTPNVMKFVEEIYTFYHGHTLPMYVHFPKIVIVVSKPDPDPEALCPDLKALGEFIHSQKPEKYPTKRNGFVFNPKKYESVEMEVYFDRPMSENTQKYFKHQIDTFYSDPYWILMPHMAHMIE